MNHSDSFINIAKVREVYQNGGNIIKYLKENNDAAASLSEIIEISYDLQAGTYIQHVDSNADWAKSYWQEVAGLFLAHAPSSSAAGLTMLDVGSGELTSLSGIASLLPKDFAQEILAFDISWSRLIKGKSYLASRHRDIADQFRVFSADMLRIPLPANSVDLVTSNHALEPNRAQQLEMMTELFRVAKRRLVLCEPGYEIASPEARNRMDEHGYIKDLDSTVAALGGEMVAKIPLKTVANPLNPTVCYVIDVKKHNATSNPPHFTVPGSDAPLREVRGFYHNQQAGLSYPVLDGVPILRAKNAIVSTALLDD